MATNTTTGGLMIDTVKLVSPSVSEVVVDAVELHSVRRSALDLGSGELIYELTAGSLEGSYDSRVSVRVMRTRWVSHKRDRFNTLNVTGKVRPAKGNHLIEVPCEPYLILEGSVHKGMLGHNVYGGPESFQASCRWLVGDVGARVGVELPDAGAWNVGRVDVAEIYSMGEGACEAFVVAMGSARYSRRKVALYGAETASFGGRSSRVNVYHKGPEFAAHDGRRLRGLLEAGELRRLQLRANETLRCEVQIKADKLRYDHLGDLPRVCEVTDEYLRSVHDLEMRRLVGEGKATMKKVRRQKDVRARLHEVYKERLAGLLFGLWMQLAALGESEVRKHVAPRTFRRQRKQLLDAGVSWHGGDVLHVENVHNFPADFTPLRSDPRHVVGEDPGVVAVLAPFRAA